MESSSKGKEPLIEDPKEKKNRIIDMGWMYGERIGNDWLQVKCNLCEKFMKSGGYLVWSNI